MQEKNKELQKIISIDRFIGKIHGKANRPTVVIFSGIHGNEKAGVFALKEVFKQIDHKNVKGNIYGISGNHEGLQKNQRFIDVDLNRIWTKENIIKLTQHTQFSNELLNNEEQNLVDLFKLLEEIINSNEGPFYFIDIHTTSSKTTPFITINDALINRIFSKLFPVPIVLGIEEYLNGPLLSYINELGYISLGFEAGQHYDSESINNSVSFVFLTLFFSGILKESDSIKLKTHLNQLKSETSLSSSFFEIIYLQKIKLTETFKMEPGFKNFQSVKKGTKLAFSNGRLIKSKYNAKIFMPLYQDKGNEGFFIIKRIAPFFLKLSALLRRIKADNLFVLFPGVSWANKEKKVLVVDLKTAKFMVKPLFHLLGYRNKETNKTHLNLYNRDRVAKADMYKKEEWYKNPC